MRILAIRGCNLASLAGEFEIDLAAGALGGAGVFAIVGPTGAGKSTLLDAMCVALFDRTPRLTNHSRVVVGRGDDDPTALGAQDVRTLLRRGASAGWAEVDFESGDSRRYRARWSVRRARGATDGRFQSQQVTLAALDRSGLVAEQLGGTKTETLEAIHQRLGLTFDQFRRSALLAQGEFAAFLRADGKDRSELLERMTGTEIYSQLSIAAHVKAALAEQQLRERQGAALAIAVLSPEARAQAEADLDVAKQAQAASRARLAAAEAAARWLAEAKSRRRALLEAETARSAAEQAVDAAQVLRAELALRRRAEAMRPTWDEAARLDRQLAIAQGELAAVTEAAERASAAQRDVATRRARLVELHTPIREARIAAGLRIDERASEAGASSRRKRGATTAEDAGARVRGGVARNLGPTVAQDAGVRGGIARDLGATSARDAFDAQLEARAVEATMRDAAWLAARASLVDGIASWRELDNNLAQHAALAAEIVAADRALDEHARRRDLLGRQRTAAALEHQQAQAKLGEAQREADAYSKRRGLTLDAARRAEDEARKRSGDFDRLLALTGEARGAATARAELERQLGELAAAAAGDGEARRIAEFERDTASTLRTERARVVEELRKAAGYAHARTELVEGEPCALCGATEHPWAGRGSFEPLIADAQDRLAESAGRFERALATLAGLDARDQHRAIERQRLTSCLATAERSAAAAQASWREQLAALGELLLVDDPSSDAAKQLADERIVAARSKLDAARTARHQAEAVAKAGAEAQALVQTRHNDVEQHARTLRELDTALASIEASVARVRGERAGKVAREIELLVAIDAALVHWSPVTGDATASAPARDASSASSDAKVPGDSLLAVERRVIEQARAASSASNDAKLPGDALSPVERRVIEQARAVIAPVIAKRPSRLAAPERSSHAKSRSRTGSPEMAEPSRSRTGSPELAEPSRSRTGSPELAEPSRSRTGSPELAEPSRSRTGSPELAAPSSGVVETATDAGKSERLLAPDALAILERCRRALAELVEAWGAHADVVVELDAALATALVQIDELARDVERAVTEHAARRDACTSRRDAVRDELAAAAERLDAARIGAGFERAELGRLLADDPAKLEALGEQLDALERAADRARTLVAERRRLVEAHAATRPSVLTGDAQKQAGGGRVAGPATDTQVGDDRKAGSATDTQAGDDRKAGSATDTQAGDDRKAGPATDTQAADDRKAGPLADKQAGDDREAGPLADREAVDDRDAGPLADTRAADDLDTGPLADEARRVPDLAAAVAMADHQAAALAAALVADADAQRRRADAMAELAAAERAAEIDRVLGQVIGSHDGKLFRSFAQSLTLDGLLAVANSHLEELAPRYQLERVPKHDLELQVIDRDLGDEIRSVQTLSGGESFLVSLALALGLSSMSAHDVRVRTLLIDEGFGTLDPATLDTALAVLDALQATGRQVGVISHVPALVERVGAHIRVSPKGGGRSEVVVAQA